MDADGRNQVELAATTRGSDLRWSPDGTRFAFTDVGGIYVMNDDGSGRKGLTDKGPITDGSSCDGRPTWHLRGPDEAAGGRNGAIPAKVV